MPTVEDENVGRWTLESRRRISHTNTGGLSFGIRGTSPAAFIHCFKLLDDSATELALTNPLVVQIDPLL